jgi:ATP-binding cassette subfamily C (CFTR/MRP) protein 1
MPRGSESSSSNSQALLYSTGSFTGFRSSIVELGHGYLSAEKKNHQPLCGNKEGWGPLAPERYDFTPCFMDVWVSTVAIYGILFGAVAVWWLVRRKHKAEVEKDWNFWTKQVSRRASFSFGMELFLELFCGMGLITT